MVKKVTSFGIKSLLPIPTTPMVFKNINLTPHCLAAGVLACSSIAHASQIRITLEAPSNLGLAPGLVAVHDGSVDFFDTGSAASAGLEVLAEVGDTTVLQSSLASSVNSVTIANGGPFLPGTSNSVDLNVSLSNTMLSFAAMVLPSNDWFIGNNAAFDISAILSGAVGTSMSWDFGRVYDAGTEAEDFAFSPGNGIIGVTTPSTPGGGTSTANNISLVSASNPFSAFLNPSAGFDPTTFDFNAAGVGNTTLGRLTVTRIPEPSSIALLALGGLGFFTRRKR